MEIEAARTPVYRSAYLMETDRKECMKISTMAKVFAAEVAQRAANNAIQVFGGYGLLERAPINRVWRDSRVLTITEGSVEVMLDRIALHVGARPAKNA